MKRKRLISYRAVVSSLGVLVFVSLVVAQSGINQPQNEPIPFRKQARTIPTSDDRITLKITLPDGQLIQATERNGGMIRIEKDGVVYGITPLIRDKDNGIVSVEIFRVTTIRKGKFVGEAMSILESLEVNKSSPKNTSTDLQLGIQVESIKLVPKSATDGAVTSGYGQVGDDFRCCVTCGTVTACACAVVLSCGNCCAGPCC